MTASDVAYSFNMLKLKTHPQHALWADTGLKSVKAKGNTVVFSFAASPVTRSSTSTASTCAIVPQHVFTRVQQHRPHDREPVPKPDRRHRPVPLPVRVQRAVADVRLEEERTTGGRSRRSAPSRPDLRRRHQERHERGRARQLPRRQHRPVQQLRPEVGDQGQREDVLQQVALPCSAPTPSGSSRTRRRSRSTTRRSAGRSPTRSTCSRSSTRPYQGLVAKASPTGLLPIWNKWVNKNVVSKYGFSYNVAKAKAILAAAGYKDTNGDGYVENKDGSKIDLSSSARTAGRTG